MRADAGFGYGPVLDMLEARWAQYAVVARMIPSLKHALGGLRYEPMNRSWEIAEFEHRPHDWPQARRCIVARRRIEETDPQPTLFTLERYAYRAWHTNLALTPAGVWHFYDGRAGMERTGLRNCHRSPLFGERGPFFQCRGETRPEPCMFINRRPGVH